MTCKFLVLQENFPINVELLKNKTGETTAGAYLLYIAEIANTAWQIGIGALLIVNSIQDGLLRDCLWIGGGGIFLAPLPKICHIYPTMMKLGAVIPYLGKTQKIYKSLDTSLEFCWHQHFFTRN